METNGYLTLGRIHLWLLGVLGLLIAQTLVKKVFFSPLRKYPGPILAKFTSLWLVMQCRLTRRSQAVMEQHHKYGDFVRIGPNHLSIADPVALQQIYGHKGGFVKSPFYDAFHQVRPVIFTSRDVGVHQRKRKYLNPAFSARNLRAFEPYMSSDILKFKSLVAHVAEGEAPNQYDMCRIFNYLTFDVIANYSFGRSFGFLTDQKDEGKLVETIDSRGETVNALGSMSLWLRPFMKYAFFDLFWYKGLRAKANLAKYSREAYERRRRGGTERQDLLSFLFDVKDPDSGRELDGEEIVAESISFIIGGSDTTSSTMTNFADLISRRPDAQKRLQQELDTAYPDPLPADWVADAETTEKLPLLIATLREVMRFRPTSSTGLERICPLGGSSIAGKFIPENTIVSVPTMNVMMDPRIFKDPEDFNPDRWLESGSNGMLEFFHPFSLGPRSCIGRNFAWMEMTMTMATLFRLFDLKRLRIEPTVLREGFFVKSSECWVNISKRC